MRKAVLFDMDGVITDTERFYVDGMLDLLKRNGIHLEPTDLQEFFGSPLLHNCTVLQARYHLAKTPQECMDEVVTYRDQQIQIGGLQPMDGVLELIRELHDADVKMAVASSSTMDNIVHNMETLGIKGCFKALSFLLEETSIEGTNELKITHETIANHLGSHREVITRMLRYFQGEGLVKLSRGKITILDPKRLETLQRS